MSRLIIMILLSLAAAKLHAQILLDGVVKDSVSNKPVAYASVTINGNEQATISNEEGAFVVRVGKLPCQVSVFCIGYESYTGVISQAGVTIRLRQQAVQLEELVVKPNEAEMLFLNAYKKLRKQKYVFYPSKCFFRLVTKNDSTYSEMIESFYSTLLAPSGIRYWELDHGRYALVKDQKEKNYAVSLDFSLLSKNLDVLNNHETPIPYPYFPFRGDAMKYYRFKIGEKLRMGDRRITRVDYEAPHDQYSAFFNGTIYIDEKDFRIYRVEAWVKHTQEPPFFSFDKRLNIERCNFYFDIRFTPHDQKQLISAITMKTDYDQSDKVTAKVLHHVSTYSSLYFYQYDPKPRKSRKLPEEDYETDYSTVKQRLYIKKFWDENPVIAETPVEKNVRENFERSGSFGLAFNTASDTLELQREGAALWKRRSNILLDRITNHKDAGIRMEKTEINKGGEPVGGLYGDIYFAWNCYHDSLLYCLLATMDMRATWISDSLLLHADVVEELPYMEFVYQKYFDITEIYKRRLKALVLSRNDWCANRRELKKQYETLRREWYAYELSFLNDVWGEAGASKLYKWTRDIETQLNGLEVYR